MAREVFLGLTTTDFGHSMLNTLGYASIIFAGAGAAYLTSLVSKGILKSKMISFLSGSAAGIAATYFAVKYAPHVILPDQKALKFLVMAVVSVTFVKAYKQNPNPINTLIAVPACLIILSSVGGMFAHIGRGQLYVFGVVGSGLSVKDAASVAWSDNESDDGY